MRAQGRCSCEARARRALAASGEDAELGVSHGGSKRRTPPRRTRRCARRLVSRPRWEARWSARCGRRAPSLAPESDSFGRPSTRGVVARAGGPGGFVGTSGGYSRHHNVTHNVSDAPVGKDVDAAAAAIRFLASLARVTLGNARRIQPSRCPSSLAASAAPRARTRGHSWRPRRRSCGPRAMGTFPITGGGTRAGGGRAGAGTRLATSTRPRRITAGRSRRFAGVAGRRRAG